MKPNWASTAINAHLQYQHSICKLYTVELMALADDKDPLLGSGKWLNLGLSDALTGSCACTSSRQARRSAFIRHLAEGVSPPQIRTRQQRVSIHIGR